MTGPGAPLPEILAPLRRAVRFQRRLRPGAVRDLERLADRVLERAREAAPSQRKDIDRAWTLFRGIDAVGGDLRSGRLAEAEAILEGVERGGPVREADPLIESVSVLPGVGPKMAQALAKRGLRSLGDLLYFLPRAYEDRRAATKIRGLAPGGFACVEGVIAALGVVPYAGGRRRFFEMAIRDESGSVTAKWFAFDPRAMRARFQKGDRLLVAGPVSDYRGRPEFHHPELEVLAEGEDPNESGHLGRIVPVYPEVQGVGGRTVRKLVRAALERVGDAVPDGVPEGIRRGAARLPLGRALRVLHDPPDDLILPEGRSPLEALRGEPEEAFRRLVFDEFFALELGLAMRRSGVRREPGRSFAPPGRLVRRLRDEILPFRLTRAQERVASEIASDMGRATPMNRLLQGDVGSGKTVVALEAALTAIESGAQAALMAPTEILAEQHASVLERWTRPLGIPLGLLTAGQGATERKRVLEGIASGAIRLAVGTHALIQGGVDFRDLGIAIVDEQHRFGVLQRAALRSKGARPDVLVMTATPIPRTLTMTVYGDLDVSVLDEIPPGRPPVTTRVLVERERGKAYARIREEIEAGHRVFVVYPLIEESEKMDLKDAAEGHRKLSEEVFPDVPVGLLHGRMRFAQKEGAMQAFAEGRTPILVATTVIEVGIDVPEATLLLVEHAERFGLSQLHQLRGRIGRGGTPSECLLLTAGRKGDAARRRLSVMSETTDGFRIAEADLEIRGPGEVLGTRQWGMPDFRVASLLRDPLLLAEARREAFRIVEEDPLLDREEHRTARRVLEARWGDRLGLSQVG